MDLNTKQTGRGAGQSEPTLIYRDGFLASATRPERVTEDELRQAAWGQGHADFNGVRAMLLETDGTLNQLTESVAGLNEFN